MQATAKRNRIQKLSDLVNTALTEEQCIINDMKRNQEKQISKP